MAMPKSLTTVTPLSKFLAMILFITLPFLGFYLGMQYQEIIDFQNQQVTAPTTLKPHPAPSTDLTANWKTYTNAKYNYSVKYPADYPPSDQKASLGIDSTNSVIFGCANAEGVCLPPYYISVMPYPAGATRDISIYNSLSQSTLDKIFSLKIGEQFNQEMSSEIDRGNTLLKSPGVFKRLEDKTISGKNFLVLENPVSYGGSDRRLFIKKNNLIYMLGATYQTEKQLTTFDQILSTFQFID